jgi:hypothetical protein
MKGTYNMPVYEKRISERTLDITSRVIDLRVANIDYTINTLQGTKFKEVLSKFDNKVFNKRFETALQEVSKYIRVNKTSYNEGAIDIEFYFSDRRSVSTPRPNNDYTETTYIEWDTETIGNISLDGTRISKANILNLVDTIIEQRLIPTREKLLNDKAELMTMVEEYNKIAEQVKIFENEYSYETRHRLGLKF